MNPLTREELRTKLMTKYGLHSTAVDEIMALVETQEPEEWWITKDDTLNHKVIGPFNSAQLALDVRGYVEKAHAPRTYWIKRSVTPKPPTNGSLNHGEK